MRLSKIKLAGFKSFVDPTTVHLHSNLVGIVGPNGSGKSNIIDAVRWVMGESSAKNLRGGSMADVIFNGSASRKPVGQAFIELLFDNSSGGLGGEYAAYSEIAIKRQVSRDGQSVYFLNGARCRRRDIIDIFLGTGLGPRSYAIIEQGMISRLIEAKPDDLRVLLEEAAGISKYKERRRETETRIRHTQENLSRMLDLQEELGKQLEKLQRQARAAEKYRTLKQQVHQVQGELYVLQWRQLDVDTKRHEKDLGQFETQLEAEIAAQRSLETELEKHRAVHLEVGDHLHQVQGEFYQLGAEISNKEQTIQHTKERAQQLQQDIQTSIDACQQALEHQQADKQQMVALDIQLEKLLPEDEQVQAQVEATQAALDHAESYMHEWQPHWDEFNQQVTEVAKNAEIARTRIAHFEQQAQQAQRRYYRLDEEIQSLDEHRLAPELVTLNASLTQAQQQVETLASEAKNAQQQVAQQRENHHHLNNQLAESRGDIQQLRGRIASLEALQEDALGQSDANVSAWLQQQNLADKPRLAQQIKVATGWESAIELVLSAYLDAVCVDDIGRLADQLLDLPASTVGFCALPNAVSKMDHSPSAVAMPSVSIPLATQLIEAPFALQSLLSGVYFADSLEQALAVRDQLQPHESIITAQGYWLSQTWLRTYATESTPSESAQSGVLQREQALQRLLQQAEQTQAMIAQWEHQLDESKHSLEALESQRESSNQTMREAEHQLGEIKAQISGKQARLEQINRRYQSIETERSELHTQIQSDNNNVQQTRKELTEAIEIMEQLEQQGEGLKEQKETLQRDVQEARYSHQDNQQRLHEIRADLQAAQAAKQVIEQNLIRVHAQIDQHAERKQQLNEMLTDCQSPFENIQQELDVLLAQRLEKESALAELRQQVESLSQQLREWESQKTKIEQQIQTVRDKVSQQQMALQTCKVRRQTVNEQLDEAGYELEVILTTLPQPAEITQWEQNLATIEQSIVRLGAINLAAIEEFEEQSTRKQYLESQYADLTEALATLDTAMRKIDRETRAKFKDTFDQVNQGLKGMFPRLFGGGEAYLELTGDNLLDTGVGIMARPPGKRISNIHLLSGGEKALTAVALVFAIFELNPAPFCMLDEVDAPLDEANVGRFCQLVKAMSEHLQFIFITHNKTTMEIADHLNGVTMQEPGVSRMVSVDVQEAADLAAM